jgi:hypothetical protein
MGYVYITKGYKDNFDRIKAILDWLRAQNNGKDIGDFEFDDLNAWFCKHYGACDAPVLDFHFLKGNCVGRPDYTYQPCHTKFGTPEDCTRNPKEFTPTKGRPDYFGDSQLVSKMCCCKNKRKLVPIRRPKLVPIRRKPPEEIGLDRR